MRRLILFLFLVPGAAFAQIGTQVVTDDFNRANQNPISGNWTQGGAGMTLTSNTAQPASFGAADTEAIWNIWASGNDQYSQAAITIVGTSAGAGLGVYARHSSTASVQTGYRVVVDASGNYDVEKLVSGSGTSLRSGTLSYVAGQKLGLSASGGATTTLKVWYNNVQIGADITDSSSPLTTGVPGIGYSSVLTSGNIDNWDAGTLGVTAVNFSTRNFFLTK